jgi:hypothetical protein
MPTDAPCRSREVGIPSRSGAGNERLLKKFPYGRVDDWSNFLSVRDVVTGGRGLASTFPGAQDFVLTNVRGHGAELYLGDLAVTKLIAHSLYPSKDVVPAGVDIAVRMGEAEGLHATSPALRGGGSPQH